MKGKVTVGGVQIGVLEEFRPTKRGIVGIVELPERTINFNQKRSGIAGTIKNIWMSPVLREIVLDAEMDKAPPRECRP